MSSPPSSKIACKCVILIFWLTLATGKRSKKLGFRVEDAGFGGSGF